MSQRRPLSTSQDAGDASQAESLLDQIDGEIGQFTADSAYDRGPTYAVVLQRKNCHTAAGHGSGWWRYWTTRSKRPPYQGDAEKGRLKWQAATGYGKRALIETPIGRHKGLISRRLRARSFAAQKAEVAIGCAVLNRMHACARPESVRCTRSTI